MRIEKQQKSRNELKARNENRDDSSTWPWPWTWTWNSIIQSTESSAISTCIIRYSIHANVNQWINRDWSMLEIIDLYSIHIDTMQSLHRCKSRYMDQYNINTHRWLNEWFYFQITTSNLFEFEKSIQMIRNGVNQDRVCIQSINQSNRWMIWSDIVSLYSIENNIKGQGNVSRFQYNTSPWNTLLDYTYLTCFQ